MILKIFKDKATLGWEAAFHAACAMRKAIAQRGNARIIAATGASQFEFLSALITMPNLDWQKVEMFHLDEYIGLSIDHPASFRKYLLERLIRKVPIGTYHLLDGEADPKDVVLRVGQRLLAVPVDVAFVGIGENGHLAFNDPPADFTTEEPYIVVHLNEACRRQQVGEGWFASIEDVPEQALSMTIRQILKSREIVCVVPDARKAQAVHDCFSGEIGPMAPASILQTHPQTSVYLDADSASMLNPECLAKFTASH